MISASGRVGRVLSSTALPQSAGPGLRFALSLVRPCRAAGLLESQTAWRQPFSISAFLRDAARDGANQDAAAVRRSSSESCGA